MYILSESEMKNINGGFGFSVITTYILVSRIIKIIRKFR